MDDGKIIGQGYRIFFSFGTAAARHVFEIIRQAMGAENSEQAAARIVSEFIKEEGFEFRDDPISVELLRNFGLTSSGNVSTLKSKDSIQIILPATKDPEAIKKIAQRYGVEGTAEIVRLALLRAHRKYAQK
jgi:F0F1-type ATP synthase gamma subunit